MRKNRLTGEMELQYDDFEIGQYVWCNDIADNKNHSWLVDHHLTIGKRYKIKDLDFHFPNKLCIEDDKGVSMFLHIDIFVDNISYIRELTINEILKDG